MTIQRLMLLFVSCLIIIIMGAGFAAATEVTLTLEAITADELPNQTNDVYVFENYAYVADSTNGLVIVDISDHTNPITVGNHPSRIGEYGSVAMARGVAVSGNYAYVANWYDDVYIIDISDRTNPMLVTTYKTDQITNDVTISGDYAFISRFDEGVDIVNISDPTNPRFISNFNYGWASNVAILQNYAYVADTFRVTIVDISDLANPLFVGSSEMERDAADIEVSGKYAYVADAENGLVILNVSNPAMPTIVGHFDTSAAWGIALFENYILISDGLDGIIAIDVSDPINPILAGSYDTPGYASGINIDENLAYVADDRLVILNIGTSSTSGPVHNINKGTHYTTIQAAIDDANPGDEIHVDSGTYYENVVVNKQLILRGIDTGAGMPLVDAGGSGSAITLSADGVTLEGFEAIHSYGWNEAGIKVISNASNIKGNNANNNDWYGIKFDFSSNNIIIGNIAYNNSLDGIHLSSSNNNTISSNIVSENSHGISVSGSSNNNTILSNIVSENYNGIFLSFSSNNTIEYNNASYNTYSGIYFDYASYNLIRINNVTYNNIGISLDGIDSINNIVYHNNLIKNSQNAAEMFKNFWDNNYPSGGNFWDDYIGIDNFKGPNQDQPGSDGIGDTPYPIPGGSSVDNYPLMAPYTPPNGPVHNINKGTDYTTIQAAIDDAGPGDEIHVDSGTYYENVVVDKQLILRGIDTGDGKPVVDVIGSGNAITLSADGCVLEDFKITTNELILNEAILVWSQNNKIKNNYIFNSYRGIRLFSSSHNDIANNVLTDNEIGILLDVISVGAGPFTQNNTIINNNISNNRDYGIYLVGSSPSYVVNNRIYYNNLINNNINATDFGSDNYWDNGYPSGGNYWGDYTGADSNGDGIGDTPYPIPGGSSVDRYPLMASYIPPNGPQDKSLLQVEGQPEVYWLQNSRLYWVTDWDVISQMSAVPGWDSVNTLPASEFDPADYEQGPRFITTGAESDGLLIREQGQPEVYLIQGGEMHHFTSPEALLWNGYSFDDVINVSSAIIGMFSSGTDISITRAIIDKYYEQGGATTFGPPVGTGEQLGDPDSSGVVCSYVNFQNGAIEYFTNGDQAGNAYAILNPFFDKWASMGYAKSVLGYPISDMSDTQTSSFGTPFKYQNFMNGTESGSLEYNLSSGEVFEIHGAIFATWSAMDYANSILGLVTSDEREAVPSFKGTTGRVSDFENGHLHWHSSGDHYMATYMTYGDLDELYVYMGETASWLGFPVMHQEDRDGYGYCEFERGYIEWDVSSGEYEAKKFGTPNEKKIPVTLYIEDAPDGVKVNKAPGDIIDIVEVIENQESSSQDIDVRFEITSDLFGNPTKVFLRDSFTDTSESNTISWVELTDGVYSTTVNLESGVTKQVVWRFEIPDTLSPQDNFKLTGKTYVDGSIFFSDDSHIKIVNSADAIIITNRKLLFDKFGNTEIHKNDVKLLLNNLYEISDGNSAGEKIAVVYYVDRYSNVAENWDQQIFYPPLGVISESINEVALTIDFTVEKKQKILQSVDYLMIVGGDEIIPFYRVYNYLDTFPESLTGSLDPDDPVLSIYSHNYFPTDNVYADIDPFSRSDMSTPDLSTGRITAASAKDMRQLISNGISSPTEINNAVVASIDGLDMDTVVMKLKEKDINMLNDVENPITVENNIWRMNDLINIISQNDFEILSIAGHANYYVLTSSDKEDSITSNDIGDFDKIKNNKPFVAIMPCHAGLITDQDGSTWEPEWDDNIMWAFANKGASGVLASGSFVSASTRWSSDPMIHGEQLYNDFFEHLITGSETTLSVGEALKRAENYYKPGWVASGNDKKAVLQFSIFGVPWMKFDPPVTSNDGKINSNVIISSTLPIKIEDNTYKKTFEIDISDYSISSVDQFDLITIEESQLILSDLKPILPKINIEISLPHESNIKDVNIIPAESISLGNLNIPSFQSSVIENMPNDDLTADTDISGLFPTPRFVVHTSKIDDHELVTIVIAPVQYDTITHEANFFAKTVLEITYETPSPIVVTELTMNKPSYNSGEEIITSTSIDNIGDESISGVRLDLIIKDMLGQVQASTSSESFDLPSGTSTINAAISSDGLPQGSYLLEIIAIDSTNSPRASTSTFIYISSGKISNFLIIPNPVTQGDDITFEFTFENFASTSVEASSAVHIYNKASVEVAYLPAKSVIVDANSIITVNVSWNTEDKDIGDYTTQATILTADNMFGPLFGTFEISLLNTPPIITFISPTDPIGTTLTTRNWTLINVSLSESGVSWLEWNGINESMSGSGTNWYIYKTDLTNDVYTYRVWANDSSGNENSSETRTIELDYVTDNLPPIITITSPINDTLYKTGSVDLNYTVNEPTDWEGYSLNGADNITLFGNTTLLGLNDGSHILTVYANDTAGNMNSSTVWFTIDTTPPSNISDLLHTAGITWLNWTWTNPPEPDFNHTEIYLNGTFITNIPATQNYYNATGLLPDTSYELGTHTVDTSGNVNETWVNDTASTLPVTISDTIPPVIKSVILNTTNTLIGNDILVTVEAIDNIGVTAVEAEGIALSPAEGDNWTGTITTLEGTHIVHVSASDAAGNVGWNNSTSYTAGVPSATLTFVVTDNITKEPLQGAIVSIRSIKVTTNQTGVAEITDLAFGDHKWAIRMHGYKRISEVVSVNGNMTIARELVPK